VLFGLLIPLAVLGILALAAVLFFQRGTSGLDASPRSLLRLYLYLGSLVSIVVLVIGLTQALTGVLGTIAPEFTYGQIPQAVPMGPDGTVPPGRLPPPDQYDRRSRESLLQGITGAVAGGLFWAVHWYGRRSLEAPAERTSFLRRGYYLLGTAVFGIASIVLVPTAVYNALRWFLIPVAQFEYRPGAGETLAAAAVVAAFWLAFLRIVVNDLRHPPAVETT
jgi:hypothetical protein